MINHDFLIFCYFRVVVYEARNGKTVFILCYQDSKIVFFLVLLYIVKSHFT